VRVQGFISLAIAEDPLPDLIRHTQSWATGVVRVSGLVTRSVHGAPVEQPFPYDVQPRPLDLRPPTCLSEPDPAVENNRLVIELHHLRDLRLIEVVRMCFP
jgi:hypothetical protein